MRPRTPPRTRWTSPSLLLRRLSAARLPWTRAGAVVARLSWRGGRARRGRPPPQPGDTSGLKEVIVRTHEPSVNPSTKVGELHSVGRCSACGYGRTVGADWRARTVNSEFGPSGDACLREPANDAVEHVGPAWDLQRLRACGSRPLSAAVFHAPSLIASPPAWMTRFERDRLPLAPQATGPPAAPAGAPPGLDFHLPRASHDKHLPARGSMRPPSPVLKFQEVKDASRVRIGCSCPPRAMHSVPGSATGLAPAISGRRPDWA